MGVGLDTAALVVDGAAVFVPGVPGGVGSVKKRVNTALRLSPIVKSKVSKKMQRKDLLETVHKILKWYARIFIFIAVCISIIALIELLTVGLNGGFIFARALGMCLFGISFVMLLIGSLRVLMLAYYRKSMREIYHIDFWD